jgi:hypothetical protein
MTIIAHKLFRKRKDGTLGPLFINRSQVIPTGEWLPAESHPTKGFAPRPGWHCAALPFAPHLKMELKSGEYRVWRRVLIQDFTEYTRPESQGGKWLLAGQMLVLDQEDY